MTSFRLHSPGAGRGRRCASSSPAATARSRPAATVSAATSSGIGSGARASQRLGRRPNRARTSWIWRRCSLSCVSVLQA